MAGRPPLPTAELEARGSLKRNPKRYANRKSGPLASNSVGKPPERLSSEQKAIWVEIVGQTTPGVLLSTDRLILEMACRLQDKFQRDCIRAGELAILQSCLSKMGFSPVDRVRVSVQAPPDPNESRLGKLFGVLTQRPTVTQ